MKSKQLKNLVLAALMLALGIVLPFVTGQIKQIGNMMLPMHIPVLLCGFICGWQYGAVVGLVLPLLRFAMFGMPPIYPTGVCMAFELCTYGFLSGWLYSHSRWQCIRALYRCLIIAMIGGRLVSGAIHVILAGVSGQAYTWKMFMAGSLLNAIPGIIVQLILIPAVMLVLDRTGLVKFRKKESSAQPEQA